MLRQPQPSGPFVLSGSALPFQACCCQLESALPKLSLMTRIRRCAICVTKSNPFTCCTGIFDLTQPCHRARFLSSDERQHPYPIRLCALKPGWPSGWGYIFWADLWSAQPGHIGAFAPGQRNGQLGILDPKPMLYESRWAQHFSAGGPLLTATAPARRAQGYGVAGGGLT